MNCKQTKVMAVVAALAAAMCSAAEFKTKASGDWSDPNIWDVNTCPPCDGTETVHIRNGHDVTFDGTDAQWYTLNLGNGTGSALSRYYQRGGTLTSQYLTELNLGTHTGGGLMELEDVDASFLNYRIVIGRNVGGAVLKMKGGSLTFGTGNALLMGISTAVDATPNRIELDGVAWTNLANTMQIGYSSAGTNIVHLRNSSLYTAKAINIGHGANSLGAAGQNFVIAENSSIVDDTTVNVPQNVEHSGHLVLSNSTLKCSQLLVGYVAGTTNFVEIIDSPKIESAAVNYLGYKAETTTHVLYKDLRAPKATVADVTANLSTRSVAPGTTDGGCRWYDITYDNCDWGEEADIAASQAYNVRTLRFLNMTLPVGNLSAGKTADAPGTLIISNCTWAGGVKGLNAANGAYAKGVARVYDSTLSGATLVVSDDGTNVSGHDVAGELLLSGGTATFGEVRIRRGTGALTLARGAKLTADTCYLPNITGSKAVVVIGEGCELVTTNKLTIGNQAGTTCELTVKAGGRFAVTESCSTGGFKFGSDCANFTLTMEGGEIDLKQGVAAFGTASGSTGVAYLRGGVLKTQTFGEPKSGSSQTIVFDGGTVQHTADMTTLFRQGTKALVSTGGAVIDVPANQRTTISGNFEHDAALAETVDGGLVKRGEGALYFTGTNTYTGATVVEAGVLNLKAGVFGPGAVMKMKGGVLEADNYVNIPKTIDFAIENPNEETEYELAHWTYISTTPPSVSDFTVTGLPEGWKLVIRNGKLLARFIKGMVLIVR